MSAFLKSHDGLEIHYVYRKINSSKPTLVFLHGLGANITEWKKTCAFARKKGYTTLAIDLRGHGLSSTPEDYQFYALEHFATDLKTILNTLNIKKLILVGHSFGGSVAIVYCTKYLDSSLKAMILIQATHKYPYKKYHELNESPIFCYILRQLIKWELITNKNFPKIPEFDLTLLNRENALFQIFDELYHTPFKAMIQCLDAAKEFSTNKEKEIISTLKHINFPTLLITAGQDKVIDPKYTYELQKLIATSQLKIFEKEGHQFPLENNSGLNKELFSFLTQKSSVL